MFINISLHNLLQFFKYILSKIINNQVIKSIKEIELNCGSFYTFKHDLKFPTIDYFYWTFTSPENNFLEK